MFILFIHFFFFLRSLKSTGGFIAVSRYASATMLPPSILSRGIGWQVVTWGTLKRLYSLAPEADCVLFCGSGSCYSYIRVVWYWCWLLCLYVSIFLDDYFIIFSGYLTVKVGSCRENAGLLALTRVGSRRVVQIAAGFMIFFSILGKFNKFKIYFQDLLCTDDV